MSQGILEMIQGTPRSLSKVLEMPTPSSKVFHARVPDSARKMVNQQDIKLKDLVRECVKENIENLQNVNMERIEANHVEQKLVQHFVKKFADNPLGDHLDSKQRTDILGRVIEVSKMERYRL